MSYVAVLALTLVIEVPVYVVLLGRWRVRATTLQRSMLAVAVNLVSHPVAMLLVVPALRGTVGRTNALALAEVGVLLIEVAALWWWLGSYLAVCTASAVANLASLSLGFLLS